MKRILVKNCSLIIGLLFLLMPFVMVGCKKGSKNTLAVSLKTPERSYYVGDNINCYSFVNREVGVEYEFCVQKKADGAEKVQVVGQSYRVAEVGDYTLFCTARKGKETGSNSIDFNVKVVEPFVVQYGTIKLPMGLRVMESMLINRFKALIYSETPLNSYLESVKVYKDFGEEYKEFNLKDGSTNDYYNGKLHILKDEGVYVYKLICENDGGKVEKEVKVEVREDFDAIQKLNGYDITYDASTGLVEWDAIENASYYRVRIGDDIESVKEGRTLNITKYFENEITQRVLEVAAVDGEGNRIGKITYDGYVVPDAFKGLVLPTTGRVDAKTRVATLQGRLTAGRAPSQLEQVARVETEMDWLALTGEYGVGTYIDFEFTGNNIPIVRLFANDVGGYITHRNNQDNNGIILMAGYDGTGSGVHAPQLKNFRIFGDALYNGYLSESMNESKLTTWAPTYNTKFFEQKKEEDTKNGGYMVNPHLVEYKYANYPYLTMQGLNEKSNEQFKYTVGTRASTNGTIVIEIQIRMKVNGVWTAMPEHNDISFDTGLTLDTYDAGNIVVIAPYVDRQVKFAFSQPYVK